MCVQAWILRSGLGFCFSTAFEIQSCSFPIPSNRTGFQSFVCPGLDLQIWAWILFLQTPSKFIHFPFESLLTELDFRALCVQAWILRPGLGFYRSGLLLVLASPGWVLLASFWGPASSCDVTIQKQHLEENLGSKCEEKPFLASPGWVLLALFLGASQFL